ncbi:Anamorsin -like protein [Capsicum baccatum]|uniref:Anamorsin-like protein n=1 Tax=Capsicum baccatum TaxID=33114 RepID=A0A2G2XLV2_CAPBA|nr:Anamorsin -like protein [Capsicum baccatum]
MTKALCRLTENLKDGKGGDGTIVVLAEDVMVPVSVVYSALSILKKEGVEKFDPMIVTQASTQSLASVGSASMDVVAVICRSLEFPSDKLCGDISRVLKNGGTENSTRERKLLLAGFSDTQSSEAGHSAVQRNLHGRLVHLSLSRKSQKVYRKFRSIYDDSDLIDEDSLLTEEDLKKPQLPSVADCEVGKTRKACKNCTCGRAEAETKVQLGPTAEQLNNPQSACGSVWFLLC